jgi:putative lipoprotein
MTHGMKYCVTGFIIAILLMLPAVSFAEDNEALHFGLSAIFGAAGESFVHYHTQSGTAERIVYGTLLGSLPGLAKELSDGSQGDDSFSGSDMAANVAGALVGSVIANLVNDRIQVSINPERETVSLALLYRF